MIAIGGTGMAPLACLLQEQGHHVRGSDGPLYPPMSTLLEAVGIEPMVGFDAAHLEPRPDLVVVGNAVPRDNPEAVAAERAGLKMVSMPEALYRFFLAQRRPLVAAGTHGKTTTTALAAWVYHAAGADPGYLIGGLPSNLPASFAVGGGERFVIEGDEYNAAYFDRGPKFLHYRPDTLILTSVEYDHADLYADPEALLAAYRKLVAGLPGDGLLIACGDTPEVRRLAELAPCRVVLYGLGTENQVRPEELEVTSGGYRFRPTDPVGKSAPQVRLAVPGTHNVVNALAVWTAARHDGLAAEHLAAALGEFRGVARRLEELGTVDGVTVVDDFAHHPTAVGKGLEALAGRFPGRRLVVLYEPRSLTAGRRFLHDAYRGAFARAGKVLFAPIFHAARLTAEERLDLPGLARELGEAGVEVRLCDSVDALLAQAVSEARAGDVMVTMSSGSFEGLPRRLLAALEQRTG